MTPVQYHAFRLSPGQDLKVEIQAFLIRNEIAAGWICTCIGSLTNYAIRFANQKEASTGEGYFEILNVSGTLSINGSHLHISLANSSGQAIGGHLVDGNIVFTTVEIIIASTTNTVFERAQDVQTGFMELKITTSK
jgi:predicted DNA-binding protein with PD1-like motif